jgi:L-lactate dehydrogenase complex protein LldG
MSAAREDILRKLRQALAGAAPIVDDYDEALVTAPWTYPAAERITRLRRLMEAVHTQTHLTTRADWPALLETLLREKQLPSLLLAPNTGHGRQVLAHWQGRADLPALKFYDRPIEEWKAELFDATPASLTGTLGAIAATGSLILWPDRDEPRLMSLVPPVHFALLHASRIEDNFHAVMHRHGWAAAMPTNALLISGPSKTADIEQVLAYGAHGPRDLIVLILQDA